MGCVAVKMKGHLIRLWETGETCLVKTGRCGGKGLPAEDAAGGVERERGLGTRPVQVDCPSTTCVLLQ